MVFHSDIYCQDKSVDNKNKNVIWDLLKLVTQKESLFDTLVMDWSIKEFSFSFISIIY